MAKKCYYDSDVCDYIDGLWQCQTCKDWYCYCHGHDTSLGDCVECCACETLRLEREEDEQRKKAG